MNNEIVYDGKGLGGEPFELEENVLTHENPQTRVIAPPLSTHEENTIVNPQIVLRRYEENQPSYMAAWSGGFEHGRNYSNLFRLATTMFDNDGRYRINPNHTFSDLYLTHTAVAGANGILEYIQQLLETKPFYFGILPINNFDIVEQEIKNKFVRFVVTAEYRYLIGCFDKFSLLNYNALHEVILFLNTHNCNCQNNNIPFPHTEKNVIKITKTNKYKSMILQCIISQVIYICRDDGVTALNRFKIAVCTIGKGLLFLHKHNMIQLNEKFQFLSFCLTLISSIRYFIETLIISNDEYFCMVCFKQTNTEFSCGHKICRPCSIKYLETYTKCCLCKKSVNQMGVTSTHIFDECQFVLYSCGLVWLK